MEVEERLAILAGGSPGIEPTIPGTAGVQFSAADAMHALSMCRDRIGALVLAVRVADQLVCLRELADLERDDVRRIGWERKWQLTDAHVADLAAMVLSEEVRPLLCRTCQGRGEVFRRRGRVEQCPTCNGARIRAWLDKDRAARVGATPMQWYRKWRSRYGYLQQVLGGHVAAACGQLARALKKSA